MYQFFIEGTRRTLRKRFDELLGTLGENFLIFLFAEHFKVSKLVSLVYNTNSLRKRYFRFSFAIPNGDQLSSGCNQFVSLY